MFSDLPQFVPQKVCLSCQGCCRFREEKSPWRPRVMPAEAERIEACQNTFPVETLVSLTLDGGSIRALSCNGCFRCAFLNLKDNTCAIYPDRPFECRLYPFLITKNGREASVAVHLSCPYVQESRYSAEFEKYTDILKRYLCGKETARFLRGNPALAGDYSAYSEEIEDLFLLEAQ